MRKKSKKEREEMKVKEEEVYRKVLEREKNCENKR